MACACPCFGDEADAEEKPNQMIQLDGLGMLRLDTQHVGQGSQGARSAKWFYFGETDNRVAVANMLLCITCLLLWILVISAASPYIWGANPPDKTNDPAKPNKTNDLGPPNAAIDSNKNQRSDGNHSKRGQGEQSNAGADDYKEQYDIAMQNIGRQTESHQTKIANLKESHEQEITNLKASHERVKTDKTKFRKALDDIQEALDYKTAELADLPEMIRESKKETEKKLQEMQVNVETIRKSKEVTKKKLQEMQDLMNEKEKDALEWKILAERWRPYAEAHFANGFETSYRINPNVEDDVYSKKTPVLYNEFREKKRLEEPKDGDDPNGNNEFVVNNTNGDDNKNVLETNDDNQ
eukprot:352273_1